MAYFCCCFSAEITPNNLSIKSNKNIKKKKETNIEKNKLTERKRSKTPEQKNKLEHQKEQGEKSTKHIKNKTEQKVENGKGKEKEKEKKLKENKQKSNKVFNKHENIEKSVEKKILYNKKPVVINKQRETYNSDNKTVTFNKPQTQTTMVSAPSSSKGKMECVDDQWKVSNFKNVKVVNLDNVQLTESVNIFNSENSTFVIKADKFKSLQIQNCQKCNIVLNNIISAIEIIDGKKIKIQVTGKCSSITIDKTIGIDIYLSKLNVETEFTTALSAEMNVHIEGNTAEEDWKEVTIPEQYQHVLDKGNLTTRVSDLYRF